MRPIQRAAVTGLLAVWLAPLSAFADSQSSNSSSNCSDGRCTRVESRVVEDEPGRRGWVRRDAWREDDDRRRPTRDQRRQRDRDDDDDD